MPDYTSHQRKATDTRQNPLMRKSVIDYGSKTPLHSVVAKGNMLPGIHDTKHKHNASQQEYATSVCIPMAHHSPATYKPPCDATPMAAMTRRNGLVSDFDCGMETNESDGVSVCCASFDAMEIDEPGTIPTWYTRHGPVGNTDSACMLPTQKRHPGDVFPMSNCQQGPMQYPHNPSVSNQANDVTENNTLQCCHSSPEDRCTSHMAAQIHDIFEIAHVRPQKVTVSGNLQESPMYRPVVNDCIALLKSLKSLDIDNEYVHKGCVILGFTCKNTKALDVLWRQWITGQLKTQLEDIFLPFFQSQYPHSTVRIVVRMCSHQYLRYWKKLATEKGGCIHITGESHTS